MLPAGGGGVEGREQAEKLELRCPDDGRSWVVLGPGAAHCRPLERPGNFPSFLAPACGCSKEAAGRRDVTALRGQPVSESGCSGLWALARPTQRNPGVSCSSWGGA